MKRNHDVEPQAFADVIYEAVLCRALAISQRAGDKILGTAHTFLSSTLLLPLARMEASQMHSQCGVERKIHGMNTWYQLCPSHDSKSA